MTRKQWEHVGNVDGEHFFVPSVIEVDRILSWNREDGFTRYLTNYADDFIIFNHELYFRDVDTDTFRSAIFHINPNERDVDPLSNQDLHEVWDIELFNDALVFVGFSLGGEFTNSDPPRLAYLDQSGERHDLNTQNFIPQRLRADGETLYAYVDGAEDYLTVDTNWNVERHSGELFL
jgi:hypothetical protein